MISIAIRRDSIRAQASNCVADPAARRCIPPWYRRELFQDPSRHLQTRADRTKAVSLTTTKTADARMRLLCSDPSSVWHTLPACRETFILFIRDILPISFSTNFFSECLFLEIYSFSRGDVVVERPLRKKREKRTVGVVRMWV